MLWELLELLDAVAVAALNGTEILRTFFGLLSRGVPARSRGKAASGVMSTIVTPRTGPEQSRPNRRHCRQKSSVSSHLTRRRRHWSQPLLRILREAIAHMSPHKPGCPQVVQCRCRTDCRIEHWWDDGFQWAGWRLMRWRMRYFRVQKLDVTPKCFSREDARFLFLEIR